MSINQETDCGSPQAPRLSAPDKVDDKRARGLATRVLWASAGSERRASGLSSRTVVGNWIPPTPGLFSCRLEEHSTRSSRRTSALHSHPSQLVPSLPAYGIAAIITATPFTNRSLDTPASTRYNDTQPNAPGLSRQDAGQTLTGALRKHISFRLYPSRVSRQLIIHGSQWPRLQASRRCFPDRAERARRLVPPSLHFSRCYRSACAWLRGRRGGQEYHREVHRILTIVWALDVEG